MTHTLKKIALLLILIISFSCNKDDATSDPEVIDPETENPVLDSFSDNFGAEISRSFIGTILDSNQQPISNVEITVGNSSTTTDSNGIFIINDAIVNERFAYIKASKNGYIHASRSVTPTSGINKVTIMMLEELVAGTTSSGVSETISLNNGASVSLNGAYIKEDGSSYEGSVDVILHHLDPVNENTNLQMPGMLYAANSENEERLLQTLGMLAVELRGSNGEDLNLADGTTAEIRVPVDASLLSTAPNTIPLWYFDEDRGYWIEDGEATLIGSEYVGTVTHFSFWNCDIPAEAIILCVNLSDELSNSLSNTIVIITSQTYGSRAGFTNAEGIVCGLVPSNEPLVLSVHSICNGNTIVYSENIGPFTSDSTIDITVLYQNESTETVTGTFTNCNGDLITNGYVTLTYNDEEYVDIVTDGTYEISFIRCFDDTTFVIEAIDYDTVQSSGEINYTLTSPLTNLAAISSCNDAIEFITYQIDDHSPITHINNIGYDINGPQIFVSAASSVGTIFFTISNITISDSSLLQIELEDINGDTIDQSDTLNIILNLTALGNVGEYIDANFSGTYIDSNNVTHTIDGAVHMIRDF